MIQYIESQMSKSLSLETMSDAELLSIVGGSGGTLVDVVFYLTSSGKDPKNSSGFLLLSNNAFLLQL